MCVCVSLPCTTNDTADHEEEEQQRGIGSPADRASVHAHFTAAGPEGREGGRLGWMMERGNKRGGGLGV